jgi:hypothetical protein
MSKPITCFGVGWTKLKRQKYLNKNKQRKQRRIKAMSPLFTNETGSRYRTLDQTRNSPKDEMERDYRNMEVDIETQKIMDKFERTPEFTKQLAINLAKRVLNITNTEQGLE